MKVLAIDPGLSGAIVLIGPCSLDIRRDFKHHQGLADAINELGPVADVSVIELVHSMPGQGVASQFSFGFHAGVATGALEYAGFSIHDTRRKPLIEVTPQRWQQYYWDLLGAPKGKGTRKNFDSPAVAAVLRPDSAEFLTRECDHNTADAILMGLWKLNNPDATTSIREKDAKRLAKEQAKAQRLAEREAKRLSRVKTRQCPARS